MSPPFVPGLQRQIECIKREVRMRHYNYPKWVASHRMTQKIADEEILSMEAVLATLLALRDTDKPVQEGLPLE